MISGWSAPHVIPKPDVRRFLDISSAFLRLPALSDAVQQAVHRKLCANRQLARQFP
jgi:hypothetical protein